MKFHLDIRERKMVAALVAAIFILVGYILTFWKQLPFPEYAAAISALYFSYAGANAYAKRYETPVASSSEGRAGQQK